MPVNPADRRDLLRWQFDMSWSLLELHLNELVVDDFFWEPTPYCWTVHRSASGAWAADFAETEPDPVPTPTIAWITWHIGWWWTAAIEHAHGRTPPRHDEIVWPGPGLASTAWLRQLHTEWIAVLDQVSDVDLDFAAAFPWREAQEKTVAHTFAWLNAELMKNAAEIGQLRILRATSTRG